MIKLCVALLLCTLFLNAKISGQSETPLLPQVVEWNEQDTKLAVGGLGVWIYDQSMELSAFIDTSSNLVTALDWSPDGEYLAIGITRPNSVEIWTTDTWTETFVIPRSEPSDIQRIEWNSDGTKLAAVNGNQIDILSSQTGEILGTLEGDRLSLLTFVWSQQPDQLFSTGYTAYLREWNTSTFTLVDELTREGVVLLVSLAFNPETSELAAVELDRTEPLQSTHRLVVLSTTNLEVTADYTLTEFAENIQWYPNQPWIVVMQPLGDLFAWDTLTNQIAFSLPNSSHIADFDFNFNGERLVLVGERIEQSSSDEPTQDAVTLFQSEAVEIIEVDLPLEAN